MPGEISRPNSMYQQLADRLAEAISGGEYEPGSMLPSETQLMKQYAVSRPTVRAAIAELRSMGLVFSQHGRGSFVRHQTTPSAVIERTIFRTGKRFLTGPQFTEAESPTVTRGHTSHVAADMLGRNEAAVFIVDRLLADDETGTRASHRLMIPFDVAERVPELEKNPHAEPGTIYSHLAAAGYQPRWSETVTARNPLPDERTTLGMTDSVPLLVTYRITEDADGNPLLFEELRTSADNTRLLFHLNATRPNSRA